jgi:hypothetical protein
LEIQAVPLVAASSAPTCDVRTDLTALGRPARRDVDELATKGPARISRLSGDLYFTPPAPVLSVGIVVFRNRIQDRLGRRDRLQCRQPRPAEIRPVCRLVADHCHICDRRPPRSTGYRGGGTQSRLNLGRTQWNPCCQVDSVNGNYAPRPLPVVAPAGR